MVYTLRFFFASKCSLFHNSNVFGSCIIHILYIYSTNIGTEYFKHGIYSQFFFASKCGLFHNSNVFGSYIIHILYTGCAKIKKKQFRRQKVKDEGDYVTRNMTMSKWRCDVIWFIHNVTYCDVRLLPAARELQTKSYRTEKRNMILCIRSETVDRRNRE